MVKISENVTFTHWSKSLASFSRCLNQITSITLPFLSEAFLNMRWIYSAVRTDIIHILRFRKSFPSPLRIIWAIWVSATYVRSIHYTVLILTYTIFDFHLTSIGVNKRVTFNIGFIGKNKKSRTAIVFSWLQLLQGRDLCWLSLVRGFHSILADLSKKKSVKIPQNLIFTKNTDWSKSASKVRLLNPI